MKNSAPVLGEVYSGLQALSGSSFPKTCTNCGRVYQDLEDFITATQSLSRSDSGLKQSSDVDNTPVIELLRNCSCGAMLMELFINRRDISEKGEHKRKEFEASLERLLHAGMEIDAARAKLLNTMTN